MLFGRTSKTGDGDSVPSGSPLGHWSADTIIGLEDGDPVGTWPDQSGNGNDLVQATAANKPTYEINEINSLPAIKGDGVNYGFELAVIASDKWSYHFVAKNWNVQVNDRFIALGDDWVLGVGVTTAGNTWWNFDSLCDSTRNTNVGGDQRNWSIVSLIAESEVLCNVWINNTDSAGNLCPYPFAASTKLGVLCSHVGRNHIYGYMAELIVYNSAISSADRGTNETGLNSKYAVY